MVWLEDVTENARSVCPGVGKCWFLTAPWFSAGADHLREESGRVRGHLPVMHPSWLQLSSVSGTRLPVGPRLPARGLAGWLPWGPHPSRAART